MGIKAALLATRDLIFSPPICGLLIDRVVPVKPRTQGSQFLLARKFKKNIALRKNHAPYSADYGTIPTEDQPIITDYVIQLHDAKRAGTHYDLRIHFDVEYRGHARYKEFCGPSRLSAALRHIPSLQRFNYGHVKREKRAVSFAIRKTEWPTQGKPHLANRVSDHNPEYSKFEGTIPPGEYGAGTVQIIETGKCWVWHSSPDQISVSFLTNQGIKNCSLVRTNDNKWLFIAKAPNLPPQQNKHPFKSLKVVPGKENFNVAESFTAEEKIDGAWSIIYIKDGKPRAFSHRISKRNGQLIEYTAKAPSITKSGLGRLGNAVVTAELYHERGAAFLGGLLNTKNPGAGLVDQRLHGGIKFKLLDIIEYRTSECSIDHDASYKDRRLAMERISKSFDIPIARKQKPKQTLEDFYHETVNYGKRGQAPNDGIVIKPDNSIGNDYWYRIKPFDTVDCTVVGFTEGNGRHANNLGALCVRTPSGKNVRVGSGFSDAQRAHIWNNKDKFLNQVVEVDFHTRKNQTNTGPRITNTTQFHRIHPSKSDLSLQDFAEGLGISKYQLINKLK